MRSPDHSRSQRLDQTLNVLLAANNVVVAVDVDGTLMNGGSTFPWLAAVGGRWRTAKATCRLLPRIALAGITSGNRADATKQAVFSAILRGIPAEDVRARSVEFAGHHARTRSRPMMQHVLAWHQRHGHRIVLVSASVEEYIKPIGLVVGADAALATRLEVSPTGALTGSYAGENCRGEEKLRRLDEWINEALPATPRAEVTLVAYGNSRGDLTMMGAALLGINCGKLGPLSRLSSYPTLEEMWRATAMVG